MMVYFLKNSDGEIEKVFKILTLAKKAAEKYEKHIQWVKDEGEHCLVNEDGWDLYRIQPVKVIEE